MHGSRDIIVLDRLEPARHPQLLELVGFARATTDRTLLARPELAGVNSVELVCQPELVGF